MSTQIFKNQMPSTDLFDLLEKICIKCDKYYIFNFNSFKKGTYNQYIQQFICKCKEYYHSSKQKYLDVKLTYKSFVTILRQICNFNKITYTSQLKYDKSSYDIIYYIYV